ncbi:MAG: hypothetical protein OQK13_03250 [Gammaproteobacteria bacterium]|nr:hypothetical protein [Gammaproteobacteria bacterium]
MKFRFGPVLILSLIVLMGCSGDKSAAKKIILDAFPKSTAIFFGKFTSIDENHGCYQIHVKDYRGQEQEAYIALTKESATENVWSKWVFTKSLDECREQL